MQLVWSYHSWVQGSLDQNSVAIYFFFTHTGGQKEASRLLSSPVIGASPLVISVVLCADASGPTDHTDNEPFHSCLDWISKKHL